VSLKGDSIDPESETVKRALIDLNFPVTKVRTRKVYELFLDSGTKKDAEASVRAMCSRLLVNPTKDEFEFEVEPVGNNSET
jgi:phosphoribosylformylglycinamidine synthase subunit PurS